MSSRHARPQEGRTVPILGTGKCFDTLHAILTQLEDSGESVFVHKILAFLHDYRQAIGVVARGREKADLSVARRLLKLLKEDALKRLDTVYLGTLDNERLCLEAVSYVRCCVVATYRESHQEI